MTKETQTLPVTIDGQMVNLEMRRYTPEILPGAETKFPTLVFNHGSTGDGTDTNYIQVAVTETEVVNFFLKRGWAVVLPYRRGRGGSDGLYDEGFHIDRSQGYTAEPKRSLAGADRALADIEAAITAISAMDFVDSKRLLIGGNSRGGILSVAYSGSHHEQICGVINFVGGWLDASSADRVNPSLFQRGSSYPKQTLWLYGDKDSFYPLAHSRQNFQAFLDRGGKGQFNEFELAAGADGHIIASMPNLWTSILEGYLKSLELPYKADPSVADFFEWPGFQNSLPAGPSSCTVKAKLPPLQLTEPEANLEASKAVLLGIWQGWLGYHKDVDLKLAIFDISTEGATIEFAKHSERGSLNERLEASFIGNRLHSTLAGGDELNIERRADGHMNIYLRKGDNWGLGVLEAVKPQTL